MTCDSRDLIYKSFVQHAKKSTLAKPGLEIPNSVTYTDNIFGSLA